MSRLAGRVAIVTGASQGLGEAIAERFAAEGASLVLCARGAAALAGVAQRLAANAAAGQRIVAHAADIGDPAQAEALARFALDAFGRIDILVNNAGVYGPMGLTHEVAWDEWVDALRINLLGLVAMCRAVTPAMIARRGGRIVNLSGGGATNPLPRLSSYAASKAAVVRFTETLALELAEHGITVNAIAPGALATRMTRQLLDAGPERVGAALHRRIAQVAAEGGTPLRLGAELAVYLASDEAAAISGRLLAAQWDPWRTLHERAAELADSDIYTLRRIVPDDRGKDWGEP
ncbi:MAG TPA: SDR family oxidoreductase [Stellaceae bacterium]|nr:SDR family oxidoreductase [Stellaceae bacterium]